MRVDTELLVKKLSREIKSLDKRDIKSLSEIRIKLNNYARTLPSKKQAMVYPVIREVKKRMGGVATPAMCKQDKHILSDHAFVRVLGRVCGLDINTFKDVAFEKLNADKSVRVFWGEDGRIKTVIRSVK